MNFQYVDTGLNTETRIVFVPKKHRHPELSCQSGALFHRKFLSLGLYFLCNSLVWGFISYEILDSGALFPINVFSLGLYFL